jgi:hypothetical protein
MEARNLDFLAIHASVPDKRMAVGGCGSRSEVDVIDALSTGFLCGSCREVADPRDCKPTIPMMRPRLVDPLRMTAHAVLWAAKLGRISR